MDTEVMESRLTMAASRLDSHATGTSVDDVVIELRSCESELVAHRFARSTARDGRSIRVKIPGVDAALIHVTRALSFMGDDSHLKQARESVENAREEVANLAAV
jgi:hypothetical protein